MQIPECPLGHGAMTLREANPYDSEGRWIGPWYDCVTCCQGRKQGPREGGS